MSIESTMSAKSLNPNVSNKFRHLVNMQVRFGEKAIHRDQDLGYRFWHTVDCGTAVQMHDMFLEVVPTRQLPLTTR